MGIPRGVARGRFVVDTHVHAQRHAARFKERGVSPDYHALAQEMFLIETYDNSARLLYDMDRYGVDMCCIQPAFGMSNEVNRDIVKRHPDRFFASVNAVQTMKKALRGEIKWTVKAAAEEIDHLLSTGDFTGGIQEGIPEDPTRPYKTWPERFDEICTIMAVARKYKCAVCYHTGTVIGYAGSSRTKHPQARLEWFDPMLAHDVKQAYPDVPLVLAHGGMEGWWSEMYMDAVMHVAATYDDVYMETGVYWTSLYEKALNDPNIGPEKLLWGTDWGASIPRYAQPGKYPPSYATQIRKHGVPAHQVDMWGWSLKQIDGLEIDQDDLNLILGGNAARLFKLKVPYTRLFKEYLKF